MDSNLDLDVNNYSVDDLLKFFKLKDNYNTDDIENKVSEMTNEIFAFDSSSYNSKHKFDIMNFIKLAKDILVSSYYEIQNKIEMEKMTYKRNNGNNIGKIINPLAAHQALEIQSIPHKNINGYKHNKNISLYIFNTATRENFFESSSTSCTFILPFKLKNVISLSLSSVQIPNVMFAFSSERGTNQLYIFEDTTNLNGVVTIPDGNYSRAQIGLPFITPNAFAEITPALEKAINEQILGINNPLLYRFKVTIDTASTFITISNTTYSFSMNTLKRDFTDASFCDPYSFSKPNLDNVDNKFNIKPSQYIDTLGYLLGFRNVSYFGSKSYTTESTFSNDYSTYLYFALDDHTGSQQTSSAYGVLQNSVINENILALIPLNGLPFNFIFDNNANFIYKKRAYYGPVDISRISIKLLNQVGKVVNLLQNNFSFSLQVTTIYDINKPYINDLL